MKFCVSRSRRVQCSETILSCGERNSNYRICTAANVCTCISQVIISIGNCKYWGRQVLCSTESRSRFSQVQLLSLLSFLVEIVSFHYRRLPRSRTKDATPSPFAPIRFTIPLADAAVHFCASISRPPSDEKRLSFALRETDIIGYLHFSHCFAVRGTQSVWQRRQKWEIETNNSLYWHWRRVMCYFALVICANFRLHSFLYFYSSIKYNIITRE